MDLSKLTAVVLCVGVLSPAIATDARFVSGLQPDRRPHAAPRISEQSAIDRERHSKGIEAFAPEQFPWLSSQGAWFNPFGSPGMTGPYDIRRWHSGAKTAVR